MFRKKTGSTNWPNQRLYEEKGFCYHQIDASGHITDVNQAWLNLTGFSKEEVIGQSIHLFMTPANPDNKNKYQSAIEDHSELNGEWLCLRQQNQQTTDIILFSTSEYKTAQHVIKTHAWFATLDYFIQDKEHFFSFVTEMKALHGKMCEHSHYLANILNSLDDFVMAFNGQQLISVNQPALTFFGCKTLAELFKKMPANTLKKLSHWQTHQIKNFEDESTNLIHIDSPLTDQPHYFELTQHAVEGKENECIIVLTDVTEKLKLKAKFASEKELSSEYLNIAKIMILALDLNGNITQINKAGSQLLGYAKTELIGLNWFDQFIPIEHQPMMRGYFNAMIMGDEHMPLNNENLIVTKEGNQRLISCKHTVLKNEVGEIIGTLSSAEDITDLKSSQKELAFLAHHDVLTGLENRSSLQNRIKHAIKKSQRSKNSFALCFIDLDNFKFINDSYGHKAGDELLISVSKRIKNAVRDSDAVARFGGDEFVILLEDIEDNAEVSAIAEKLVHIFGEPIKFNSHTMLITISMGVSVFPDDATTLDILLQNADIAMYEAKRKGKNRYALYNKKMASEAIKRARIIQELTTAITDKQIEVFYQPLINQTTQEAVGIEALARWHHPTRGMTLPEEFIPISEEAGLIVPLGEMILRQACHDIVELHNQKLFNGYVSVNVSGAQIENSKFYKMLTKTLKETNIKPSMLEIEITESVVMTNPEQWNTLFKQLKSVGLKIAIDDFGTGYSSLCQLSQLSLDKLKIDKSFINRLDNDEKARTVAQAIINLSHSMNMTSIAEGVETETQKAFLNEQNCEVGQGFLFAKPMSLIELKQWLLNFKNKAI